jgi:hypothetical protein
LRRNLRGNRTNAKYPLWTLLVLYQRSASRL